MSSPEIATPGGTTPRPESATATRILDVAEELVQTRGFNDVSYADIAVRLGITKPSLHYYYPTKAALGEAIVRRYSRRFFAELDVIDTADTDVLEKLSGYADLYRRAVAAGRMCLCGILAAEYQTLPDGMRAAVHDFFDTTETWLAEVLVPLDPTADAVRRRQVARAITEGLEGAVMLARAYDDAARFESSAALLLAGLALR